MAVVSKPEEELEYGMTEAGVGGKKVKGATGDYVKDAITHS